MTSVAEHYDRHLGPVYSWMIGDMTAATERAGAELNESGIGPRSHGIALDLGAGPGLHSLVLAELGFSVLSFDTCAELLGELKNRAGSRQIRPILSDLTSFREHADVEADAVLCMGDTLTHLPSLEAVGALLSNVAAVLAPGGIFVATFRDYSSKTLTGSSRFIPVRGDDRRILTCFLEYGESVVAVHDILHERSGSEWKMSVSIYEKLRLDPPWVKFALTDLGLIVKLKQSQSGLVRITASSPV